MLVESEIKGVGGGRHKRTKREEKYP